MIADPILMLNQSKKTPCQHPVGPRATGGTKPRWSAGHPVTDSQWLIEIKGDINRYLEGGQVSQVSGTSYRNYIWRTQLGNYPRWTPGCNRHHQEYIFSRGIPIYKPSFAMIGIMGGGSIQGPTHRIQMIWSISINFLSPFLIQQLLKQIRFYKMWDLFFLKITISHKHMAMLGPC